MILLHYSFFHSFPESLGMVICGDASSAWEKNQQGTQGPIIGHSG